MKLTERILVVFFQAAGYLWNMLVFLILVPFFLVKLSSGLDFLVFSHLLNLDGQILLSDAVVTTINLAALVIVALGALIILESVITLYNEAKAFPFTNLPHKHLRPSELAKSGWYGKVRHPMMLGYTIALVGLGVYVQSPTMIIWWVPLAAVFMLQRSFLTEEKSLVSWFGDEYKKYQKEVPALIPRFRLTGKKNQ